MFSNGFKNEEADPWEVFLARKEFLRDTLAGYTKEGSLPITPT